MQQLGPDGHPIPEKQGIVSAEIKPMTFRGNGDGLAFSGAALDADGKVIDQSELLALIEQGEKK